MTNIIERKQRLERAKDRLTNNLLQIIYSASKGQENININSVKMFINELINASTLETFILINESQNKQKIQDTKNKKEKEK